jgi:hypothetical protein
MTSRTTRVAEGLLAAAETGARRESRPVRQQLDHWARPGMHLSMQSTAARRRIERSVAGELRLEGGLDGDERAIANAEINARISAAANGMSFADRLAADGVITVVLDDQGRLVERRPDGTTTVL